MSDDKNGIAGELFGNPLPIVMVVLLAAGILVKNVPLESARPTDSERIKFVPTELQDVEARLWQDPFAAIEKHKKSSEQAITIPKNTLMMLFEPTSPNTSSTSYRLEDLKGKIKYSDNVTVVAISVFGGPYAEQAEIRRRSRFAVVSALGSHDYHPESNDTIGYFHATKPYDDDVPYEWFKTRDKSSNVLVLWLNEDKLTSEPLKKLQDLFDKLIPQQIPYLPENYGPFDGLNVKLIGPAGSAMLMALISDMKPAPQPISATGKKDGSTLQVFASGATTSDCDLLEGDRGQPWDCFMRSPYRLNNEGLPIVRTTGTDDVLAASLLWELWIRGVNRDLGYVDSWWDRIWPTVNKWFGQNLTEFSRECEDGLVLIGERDTEYGRTLSRHLVDGFSDLCKGNIDGPHDTSRSDAQPAHKPPVRIFNYLRGLDGVLPDIDKSGGKAPPKNDSGKSKDLREQLDDAPPEQAEGRNQFDYLRRLADEIDRLDDDKKFFAEKGVKAIGIVGSDVYDKLLILQALRSRFKDKIFFTTDLDARYLHADQKDWARNLVVASNFGLSLRPALQHSTLPFRDGYQTATYLATLMAIEKNELRFNWPVLEGYPTATHIRPPMARPKDWTEKMEEWLRPQIFEIGRTEAVHLASPSVEDLTKWIRSNYSDGTAPPADDTKCDDGWKTCTNIEPDRRPPSLLREHPWAISFMACFGLLLFTLANRHVNETVRTAFGASSPERIRARAVIFPVIAAVAVVFIILAVVRYLMQDSLAQGIGEPFRWLEGISVWPSLVIRFVGLVTMLALWYAFLKMIQQKEEPYKDFEIALPKIRKLNRSKMSAWLNGPHLNLALFDKESNAEANSAVKEERTGKKIIDVTTLWQNYLLATSWREMAGWIVVSLLIGFVLVFAAFQVLGRPSFPHRGQLVETLHRILVILNALVLWLVIFWVGYEARACTRFIETLSNARSLWSPVLLDREEASTGVPRAHLDDHLDFRLIVHATQRIHWLIYLPFVSILFMVLSRSNFFDAMDFPLTLVFVVGLALAYALHSAWFLRRSAESARDKAIEHYERRLLIQARVKDSQPPILIVDPISVEQIKLLMERIRNNREGAFASFAQQPALQALLIPFGGYGSVQLIEYLFKL